MSPAWNGRHLTDSVPGRFVRHQIQIYQHAVIDVLLVKTQRRSFGLLWRYTLYSATSCWSTDLPMALSGTPNIFRLDWTAQRVVSSVSFDSFCETISGIAFGDVAIAKHEVAIFLLVSRRP